MPSLGDMTSNPGAFVMAALLVGFGAVALAKLYGLIFMRWKTPFRVGEAMNVNRAEVVEWSGQEGYVSAGGELWRAQSKDALAPGDEVAISAVNGLLLKVKKQG
ncbi:NfeD family protein [Hyphococcus sp.]|uniref:NfeD family protein n=1 Tax=Hyphococcus sp. TaxID=2038636 RepID=UPI003CCC11E8